MKQMSNLPGLRSAYVCLLVALVSLSGCGNKPAAITLDPPKPVINPTITSLTVTPSALMPGQTATLAWSVTGASDCKAAGAWSGTVALAGSLNVTLTSSATQTYTLQCSSSSGGFAQQSATLSVPSSAGSGTPVCSTKGMLAASKRPGRRHLTGSHS